jgi:hypothetical protein
MAARSARKVSRNGFDAEINAVCIRTLLALKEDPLESGGGEGVSGGGATSDECASKRGVCNLN